MFFFFFFNDTATTEIYTLSLHDALPICHTPESSWTYSQEALWLLSLRAYQCPNPLPIHGMAPCFWRMSIPLFQPPSVLIEELPCCTFNFPSRSTTACGACRISWG